MARKAWRSRSVKAYNIINNGEKQQAWRRSVSWQQQWHQRRQLAAKMTAENISAAASAGNSVSINGRPYV